MGIVGIKALKKVSGVPPEADQVSANAKLAIMGTKNKGIRCKV